jgi:hypothetical protein
MCCLKAHSYAVGQNLQKFKAIYERVGFLATSKFQTLQLDRRSMSLNDPQLINKGYMHTSASKYQTNMRSVKMLAGRLSAVHLNASAAAATDITVMLVRIF